MVRNGRKRMDRSKLGKVLLLIFGCPLALLLLINCIASYIPPTETYKKTPSQFEALFNEKMAQHGLSIDVGKGTYSYDKMLHKTVPIVCEDGSNVSCTYYPTSQGSNSLIVYLEFAQELSESAKETVYLEPILAFVMDEFAPEMALNKDESFEPFMSETYNGALSACHEFVEGKAEKMGIYISPENDNEIAVTFKRKSDEKTTLSVRFHLWSE